MKGKPAKGIGWRETFTGRGRRLALGSGTGRLFPACPKVFRGLRRRNSPKKSRIDRCGKKPAGREY